MHTYIVYYNRRYTAVCQLFLLLPSLIEKSFFSLYWWFTVKIKTDLVNFDVRLNFQLRFHFEDTNHLLTRH